MLQKIVNGIAIASGVVSLTVIGLGGYVFIRKDAIIDSVKGKVMEAVTDKLGGLGDLGGGANISKKDMEMLIDKATQAAPAQTIRIEQAPMVLAPSVPPKKG